MHKQHQQNESTCCWTDALPSAHARSPTFWYGFSPELNSSRLPTDGMYSGRRPSPSCNHDESLVSLELPPMLAMSATRTHLVHVNFRPLCLLVHVHLLEQLDDLRHVLSALRRRQRLLQIAAITRQYPCLRTFIPQSHRLQCSPQGGNACPRPRPARPAARLRTACRGTASCSSGALAGSRDDPVSRLRKHA